MGSGVAHEMIKTGLFMSDEEKHGHHFDLPLFLNMTKQLFVRLRQPESSAPDIFLYLLYLAIWVMRARMTSNYWHLAPGGLSVECVQVVSRKPGASRELDLRALRRKGLRSSKWS